MKIFKFISLALLAAAFFCQTTIAQEPGNQTPNRLTIKGQVTGENQKPLAGATVHLKNTKRTVKTDANGNFSINVPDENALLVISSVGYEQLEVKASAAMQVELKVAFSDLSDVVVVAYGTQKKSDVTGALSSIKANNLRDVPVVSLEELFKGQAAGLQSSLSSGTPGSASNVNIRGISSIGASTQPLYVIDGLPVAGQSIQTGFAESRTAMDFINPQDIESVEILKDASATSIYGARGANGVILITTKSGKAGGGGTTTFSSSVGVSVMANKIEMMTTRQAQEYWELAKARVNRVEAPLGADVLDVNTDWQKETSQPALRQNYNIGFQGGQAKLRYFVSLDYLDQEGLLKYTKYNKYSLRSTLSSQVNDKLSVENRTTISQSKNDGAFTGGQGGTNSTTSATQRILQAPTFRAPYELTGGVDPETGEIYVGPLVVLKDLHDDIKVTNITEQLTLKYTPVQGLELQTMAGLTYRFFGNDQYQGADYSRTKTDQRISAQVTNNNTTNYILENTATYRKRLGRAHDFIFLVGNTIQQETSGGTTINAVDFANTTTGVNALQNAKEITASSFKEQWQLLSFFGRVNYTLNKKYLFTGTLRRDGSSKLAAGNKWGTFPSLAVGWRISEEPFMRNSKTISNLKLRASWGQIGNSEIGVYQTFTTINSGTNGFNNQLLPYYYLSRYGDPNLKWEVSEQTNVGVDIELLKGKIALTAEVFDKRTKDLLLAQPTPLSSGFGTYLTNIGSMTNQGIEFTANYQAIQKKAFQWTTNFNLTLLKNRVTDLGDVSVISVGQTVDQKFPRYLAVGKSVGAFYLVKTAGVWQLGEEAAAATYGAKPGDWKFVDQNKDNKIDNDDRVFIGDALPKVSLGFGNTFKYKKFDLQFLISGDFGGKTLNVAKPSMWRAKVTGGAAYNLKAWSPTNPTNELAAPNITYNSEFLHDGYLESANIVRIQNVRLGYRFNFSRKAKTSIYVYASGNNVWSWSKYDGYDPEVGSGISKGIDRFAYPRARAYNLGAQLTF